jgi:hypothetical protein
MSQKLHGQFLTFAMPQVKKLKNSKSSFSQRLLKEAKACNLPESGGHF